MPTDAGTAEPIIEVRDLSANGTLVDGERIKRLIRVSPRESEIRVELCDPRHGRLLIQTGARQTVPATA